MSLLCVKVRCCPSMAMLSVAGEPICVRTSGTVCVQLPRSPPGSRPSSRNCRESHSTVFVSPGVPGARPSNSSEASTLTDCEMRSGSIFPDGSAANAEQTTSRPMRKNQPLLLRVSPTARIRTQLPYQLRRNRRGHAVDVTVWIQLDDVRADERRALRVQHVENVSHGEAARLVM